MKTIAIHISGGVVQGVHPVYNCPHKKLIIIDEDNLRESIEENLEEAIRQLEGAEVDFEIDFENLHSELTGISSDDVRAYSTNLNSKI